MKLLQRFFLLVPVKGPLEVFSIPERKWRKGLSDLYPKLGAECVERFRGPILGPKYYIWCDENGFARGQLYNPRGTLLYAGGTIVGPVAIELGASETPEKFEPIINQIKARIA